MTKVKIDDWMVCHSESGFYLDMNLIPRVGELLDLHESVCSRDFIHSHKEAFSEEYAMGSGIGSFVVKDVKHTYTKHWVEIELNVEWEWL